MSVCFYTDTFLPDVGGAEMVLDNLVRQVVARGVRAVVLAPQPKGRWDDSRLPYEVVRYRRPRSKRWGVRAILPRLWLLYRRYRFDVLHCHAAYPQAFVAASLARWTGVPFVVRPHGSDMLPGERICAHARLAERMVRSLRQADAVIAQGEFLKRVLVEHWGIDAARVCVIGNGVDLGRFAHGPRFEHPRPYILGLGNFSRRKGFDVLLRAYARLHDPEVDLLLAGDGPERAALEHLAAELGLCGRVHFLGRVHGERKVGLYRGAQFFVCPSRREPFANVVLEAMAAGLPIVATDVGGNRELVADGRCGLLVPAEDEQALASAMARMLENRGLKERFGDAVAARIRLHDWPLVAERYLSVYRRAWRAAA